MDILRVVKTIDASNITITPIRFEGLARTTFATALKEVFPYVEITEVVSTIIELDLVA